MSAAATLLTSPEERLPRPVDRDQLAVADDIARVGRIKVAGGLDAVDGAFSTIYGGATLASIDVWAYQVARGSVSVGDPIDLSKRLDNRWEVLTGPGGPSPRT